MKLINILAGALFSSLLLCPSALAKFYMENETDNTLQVGFVTLRGNQIRGSGWYTLRPGEDVTVESHDYRINKRYFLSIKDTSTGQYLRANDGFFGGRNNNVCGDCLAEFSPTSVLFPSDRYNINFDNSVVSRRLRDGMWNAFAQYISDERWYPGFFVQPKVSCYDSAELFITHINSQTGQGSMRMRVWDRDWTRHC